MNNKKQFDIIEKSLIRSEEEEFSKYNILRNLKKYRKFNSNKMNFTIHNIGFLTSIYYHYCMYIMLGDFYET